MPLVTLDEALAHLKADGDPDGSIALYLSSAETLALRYIGRKVYATEAEMTAAVQDGSAGSFPLVVDDVIKSGILLFLGDFDAHRQNTVAGAGGAPVQLPLGSRWLLTSYRRNLGF